MSYILEALKKTDQEDTDDLPTEPASSNVTRPPPRPSQPPSAGLSLTWKLVLGAFAALNLGLLALVFTDMRNEPARNVADSGQQSEPEQTYDVARPDTRANNSSIARSQTTKPIVPPAGTRPLPGIVSPRLTPAPRARAAASSSANRQSTERVYRPTSTNEVGEFGTAPSDPEQRAAAERAALAAASAARRRSNDQPPSSSAAPPSSLTNPAPTVTGPALLPEKGSLAATNGPARATETKQLTQLDPAARARLQNLNFSTHIYGTDADLRAVVVNGVRVVEGQSQGGFLLRNILEDGVVIEFEHAGVIERVRIPVLEDWK